MIVSLLIAATLRQQTFKVSPLFSDNMVLQRDVVVPVFGTAAPQEQVSVRIGDANATAVAGDDGKWVAHIGPLKAGGPFTESIHSGSTTIAIKNVMVGEVWLCSGQSNMERPESAANDYAQAANEADPAIRMFTVSKASTEEPSLHLGGKWIPSSKTTVGSFSAVALAFGRELRHKLHVPIGLINSSWGGTHADAWTSRDALRANTVLSSTLDAYLAEITNYKSRWETFRAELKKWIASRSDTGNEGYLQGWAQPHVFETDWKTQTVPARMDAGENQEETQGFDGAVWFRRTFELPESWEGKALKIELGPIRDYDDTYVNGTKVGTTKETPSDPSTAGRVYRVSPGIPVHGVNSIAIRVFSAQGVSGFTGFPEQMKISPIGGFPSDFVPLSGEWKVKVERKVDSTNPAPHRPLGPGSPYAPGGLYNGMIYPLIPYAIKGVIWYQGEADAGHADRYKTLFPTLIRNWRQKWGQSQLPFYFVQLANYKARLDAPAESDWAELREAQASALLLPHTGMATAIDIGDANTIHPTNKREVGRRLSLIALAKDYDIHEPYMGPEFHNVVAAKGSLRVFFKHAEDGLKTNDGRPVTGFAIAGDDHKFYWATATIQGTAVLISSPQVPNPVAVRYGWADNPDCNLYSVDGLPTVPFRTDSWPEKE